MTDEPYMVSEFGEIIYYRPGGCPECGEQQITAYASKCFRCGAEFTPSGDREGKSEGGNEADQSPK